MTTHREKIVNILKDKSGMSDIVCKDIEIGIYNWVIDYANQKEYVKSWKNPKFFNVYIEKARSIVCNIDNTSYVQNTNLVERIRESEFLPHELAFMKPENIFPDRWRNAVESLMKKYENAYENKAQAMTNMFKCSKCKKRECTFYEMQTRSADESCTIFVRCINCGHSWRQG
jgi:DNA-directed RNA polymerase subunit M/transcription elongation factor TFIIS